MEEPPLLDYSPPPIKKKVSPFVRTVLAFEGIIAVPFVIVGVIEMFFYHNWWSGTVVTTAATAAVIICGVVAWRRWLV